jgi:benzoylformate decarboxylase
LPGLLHLRDAQALYGLASGGIGFAVSGAIGVSLALPGRPVIAAIGDGSAMYGIQALWTAANLGLPITYVIANNRSYRILKERMGSMRGTSSFIGMDLREPSIDFVAMAQSMGVPATRVAHPAELEGALRAAIATGRPALLDVAVADGFGG